MNPHCKTLVNRNGKPVALQAILPDGTFLFRNTGAGGRLIVVDGEGCAPDSGHMLVYDASKPRPDVIAKAKYEVGQSLVYFNINQNPPFVIDAVVTGRERGSYVLKFANGETKRTVPFQIFESRDALRELLSQAMLAVEALPKARQGILRRATHE